MKTLSQIDFARHIGVHRSYITQLKQAGRLVIAANGKVDVEASMLKIKQTEDPNRDDVKKRHATERKPEKEPKTVKPKDINQVTFSEGRAKEQHFKALQAELEYKQTIGELVPKAEMQSAVADVVTTLRQHLENLPHRTAADLVGQDLNFIRSRLKQEVHTMLTELTDEFSKKMQARENALQ